MNPSIARSLPQQRGAVECGVRRDVSGVHQCAGKHHTPTHTHAHARARTRAHAHITTNLKAKKVLRCFLQHAVAFAKRKPNQPVVWRHGPFHSALHVCVCARPPSKSINLHIHAYTVEQGQTKHTETTKRTSQRASLKLQTTGNANRLSPQNQ